MRTDDENDLVFDPIDLFKDSNTTVTKIPEDQHHSSYNFVRDDVLNNNNLFHYRVNSVIYFSYLKK